MRSTEHLPAGTPSAWSLRSRHPSRQRSGAGDRGRSPRNMLRSSRQLLVVLKDLREGRLECDDARRRIVREPDFDFPKAAEILSLLNHYWDDQDLRLHDEAYRSMQDDELDKLIDCLQNAAYETASKITFLNVSRTVAILPGVIISEN